MSLNPKAEKFAKKYDSLFKRSTKGLSAYEIPLFKAMKDSLIAASSRNYVEEYHGSKHQVRFTGDGINARSSARCELSDLMIIVYSTKSKEVRLTYLQAKSERAKIAPSLRSCFEANYEQWYLLAKRPKISGAGNFNPPGDLLSGARFPSIGTFAFFYRNGNREFETFYVSANNLAPLTANKSRKGKVSLVDKSNYFSATHHYKECISSVNNYFFAYHLYNMSIGNPITHTDPSSQSLRNWICDNIRAKIPEALARDGSTELANELIQILNPTEKNDDASGFGAKSLLILKSDNDF